jgi:hypothetical protein
MDQKQPERSVGAEPLEPRAQWKAPQVDKFIAGGAEGSAGSNVEGLDGLS